MMFNATYKHYVQIKIKYKTDSTAGYKWSVCYEMIYYVALLLGGGSLAIEGLLYLISNQHKNYSRNIPAEFIFKYFIGFIEPHPHQRKSHFSTLWIPRGLYDKIISSVFEIVSDLQNLQ
jgi:hypothetical protein